MKFIIEVESEEEKERALDLLYYADICPNRLGLNDCSGTEKCNSVVYGVCQECWKDNGLEIVVKDSKENGIKIPKIDWIPFDKNNPPMNLNCDETYFVLLREDTHNDGKTWFYSVDIATPYGDYIDNFWDTVSDWCEGQRVEIVAYAEMPYYIREDKIVEE